MIISLLEPCVSECVMFVRTECVCVCVRVRV